MTGYIMLAEAVGGSDESRAALLADLAAGRIIAEGIPAFATIIPVKRCQQAIHTSAFRKVIGLKLHPSG